MFNTFMRGAKSRSMNMKSGVELLPFLREWKFISSPYPQRIIEVSQNGIYF